MKRVPSIVLAVLALIVFPAFEAFAASAEPAQPVSLEEIFAPAEVPASAEMSPMDGAIFVDAANVVITVCCRATFSACTAACGGNVCGWGCYPSGSGCSSSCDCC